MSHYLDTINQTFAAIGKAPLESLSIPFVSYRKNRIGGSIERYTLDEVFTDFVAEPAVKDAFIAMLEESACPLVQVFKETVQAFYVANNLEELEIFSEE